jgi:hypothetical protein
VCSSWSSCTGGKLYLCRSRSSSFSRYVLTPRISYDVAATMGWLNPAVLAIVTLVFTVLGLAGSGLSRQMDHLAEDLPRYARRSG